MRLFTNISRNHMPFIILTFIIIFCIYAPGLWAKYILNKYNKNEFFSGTGRDLARILLNENNLSGVKVEETSQGDHYDPFNKVVRLNASTAGRRSLTSIVIAAHEVGHAIQDDTGYSPLKLRTRFVEIAQVAEKIGAGLIMAVPLVALVTRVPAAGILIFAGGFASLGLPVIVHFITLPVEFDASFNRAMKFLETGKYIPEQALPAAKSILLACALTYVAGALAGLLNIWRWMRILRK